MKMKIFAVCSMFGFAIMICHYCGILLLPRWVLFCLPMALFLITTIIALLFEHDNKIKSIKIRSMEKQLDLLKKDKDALSKEISKLNAEKKQSHELQQRTARKLEVVTNTKNYYKKEAQRNPYSNTGN